MRALPMIILASALATITAAFDSHEDLSHAAAQTLNGALTKIPTSLEGLSSVVDHAHGAAFKSRDFIAQDDTCPDSVRVGFSANCPQFQTVVEGKLSTLDFAVNFCGSGCRTWIDAEASKSANKACFEVNEGARNIRNFADLCKTRARCMTRTALEAQISFHTDCDASIKVLVAVNSLDGGTEAKAVCEGTCVTRMETLFNSFPECQVDESGVPLKGKTLVAATKFYCSKQNNEYCAVLLRNVGRMDCDASGACTTKSSSYWCAMVDGKCRPVLTDARLATVCTSCLDGLISISVATGSTKPRDALALSVSKQLFCARVSESDVNSGYCYTKVNKTGDVVAANLEASLTVSTVAEYCAGDQGKCLSRYLGIWSSLFQVVSLNVFEQCVVNAGLISVTCLAAVEVGLKAAALRRALANIVCATNAAGGYCYYHYSQMISSTCFSSCRTAAVSGCKTEMDTLVTNAGCCLPLMDDLAVTVLNRGTVAQYTQMLFPPGTFYVGVKSYSFTASLSATVKPARENRPIYAVVRCLTDPTDATKLALVDNTCTAKQSNPPSRSMPVVLAWSRVNANAWFKLRLIEALRADLAASLGIDAQFVAGITLSENTEKKVVLRAAASSSRRQAAGELSSATTVSFKIDGASASDATSAAAVFDAKVAASTLYMPCAASETDQSCPSCVDANSQSVAQGSNFVTTQPPVTYNPNLSRSHSVVGALILAIAAVIWY